MRVSGLYDLLHHRYNVISMSLNAASTLVVDSPTVTIAASLRLLQDDGRVVTFLGRFTWQHEDERALVKLIATPLSLTGESQVIYCQQ